MIWIRTDDQLFRVNALWIDKDKSPPYYLRATVEHHRRLDFVVERSFHLPDLYTKLDELEALLVETYGSIILYPVSS